LGERVNQGANQMRAADAGAVCRADIRHQSIEKDNLSIHQYDGDFRPPFGVGGSASSALCVGGLRMRGLERHLFSVHQRGYFAILLTAQVTCHINKAGGIRVIFLRHETRVV
jgi:hypothetical protein